MDRRKVKRIISAIFFSGIAVVITYLINFWLTPYITDNIGTEAYGFVTLSRNFVSYVSILTIALNSYAARYISISHYENDLNSASKYYNTVFFSNLFLSIAILVVSVLGTLYLDKFIVLPDYLILDVKFLFILVFISFLITTLGNVLSVWAYIKNRLDILGAIKGLSYVCEAIIIYNLLKYSSPHVWFSGIGTLCAALVIIIGNIIMTRLLLKEYRININHFSFKAMKTLILNGLWNALNSLGNILNNGLDLIITNLFLSNLAMGQLSIAKTISNIFITLFSLLSQPFQPMLLKSYATNNRVELLNNLKYASKVCSLFINIAFAGFVALGLNYYKLWIPNQDVQLIYKLTVLTIFSCIFEGAVYPLYYIYTLTVKNKIPCIITIISGILNIIGMYYLLTYTSMGLYGVVITTTIIMSIISLVSNPIYMAKCLNEKWYVFYPLLLRNILSASIMTVACYGIVKLFEINNWLEFIQVAILCAFISIPIHIVITFSRVEKYKFLEWFTITVRKVRRYE